MARIEDLSEVREGVDSSKEGSIEPATALEDELVQRVRDIGFSHRVANVFQDPEPRATVRARVTQSED